MCGPSPSGNRAVRPPSGPPSPPTADRWPTVSQGCSASPARPPAPALGPGVLAVALLLVVAAFAFFGQQAPRPEFQVASIKPNTTVGARGMGVRALPGGRLTAMNAPLMMLIQNAYAVQASQVLNGPSWINSEGYDIEAKPEGNTDREHMWLMLQSLLADRFKLALHRETRELPIYTLTMTKGGLKQPPPNAGSCVTIDPGAPPRPGAPLGFPCGRGRSHGVAVGHAADARRQGPHAGVSQGPGHGIGPAGFG